jgi:hypothetical protein
MRPVHSLPGGKHVDNEHDEPLRRERTRSPCSWNPHHTRVMSQPVLTHILPQHISRRLHDLYTRRRGGVAHVRHFRPEAEKHIAEFCVRKMMICSLVGLSRVGVGAEPTIPETLADGFRRSPGHQRYHRKANLPQCTVRKEKYTGLVCCFASEATACGEFPHGGRFLRHVFFFPSWNAQACASIHLNYMDPMSSGFPLQRRTGQHHCWLGAAE